MVNVEKSRPLEWSVNLFVMLYFSLLVLAPGAYNAGPIALLLLSMVCFSYRGIKQLLGSGDRWFLWAFLGYFLIFVALNIVHGEESSSYDRPSRFLAAVLILTLLFRVRLHALFIFGSAALGGFGAGLYAFYEVFIVGLARATTHDNAIYFGNGAMTLALVSLAGLFYALSNREVALRWSLFFLVGCAGALLGTALSGTRGSWIAVPPVILVTMWTYRRLLMAHRKAFVASAAALAILSGSALTLDVVSTRIDTAVQEIEEYGQKEEVNTSVGLRLEMWKAGWIIFRENPLMGVGHDGFDVAMSDLVEKGVIDQGVLTFRHLHNQYIDNAAKGGVLGILALLVVFLIPLRLFWQRLGSEDSLVKSASWLGVSFIVSYMVFCLTQGMLSRNIGVMMYIMVPLVAWTLIRQQEHGFD